jgi:hypothetical protein
VPPITALEIQITDCDCGHLDDFFARGQFHVIVPSGITRLQARLKE